MKAINIKNLILACLSIVIILSAGCGGGGLDGYYEHSGTRPLGVSMDVELSSDGSAVVYIKNRGNVTVQKEGKYPVSGDKVTMRLKGEREDEFYTISPTKTVLTCKLNGPPWKWRGDKR